MIKKLAKPAAATAIALGFAAVTVVPASALDNIQKFGVREVINEPFSGLPYMGYTVHGLSPSSDAVAHNGQLYEATLTVDALRGWADPRIPGFGARALSGEGYPVLAGAPGSIGGGQVPPGGSSTGKLYFDVVGDVPNSVVWNDGMRDILAWVP